MTLADLRQWVIDQTEDEPEVRAGIIGILDLVEISGPPIACDCWENLGVIGCDCEAVRAINRLRQAASSGGGKASGGVG